MKTKVVVRAPKLAIKTEEEEESHSVGRAGGAMRLTPTGVNAGLSPSRPRSDSGSPGKNETRTAAQAAKMLRLHKQKEK